MLFVSLYEFCGSAFREAYTFLVGMNKITYVKLHDFERQEHHIKVCVLRHRLNHLQSRLGVILIYLKCMLHGTWFFFYIRTDKNNRGSE
jgi:hypothetical protein